MSAQQDEVARVFDAVVDLDNPCERAGYLDAACGQDPQFRAEVEELLAHDNTAGSFLGTINSIPLELKVANARALRLEPTAGALPRGRLLLGEL